jgi:hypothetical protein
VLARSHGHLEIVPAEAEIANRFKKALNIQHKGHQATGTETPGQHHGAAKDHHQGNTQHTNQLDSRQEESRQARGREVGSKMCPIEALKAL